MKYREGFLYQVYEDEVYQTKIFPDKFIKLGFISLTKKGLLKIKAGYATDGPSGPTKLLAAALNAIPFVGGALKRAFLKSFMRGAVGHDAFYEFIRNGLLKSKWRKPVDEFLKDTCLTDKMIEVRAAYVYRGVRIGAGYAADPAAKKKVYSAP